MQKKPATNSSNNSSNNSQINSLNNSNLIHNIENDFNILLNFGGKIGFDYLENSMKIPKILIDMKNWMKENKAFEEEGIFRIAGSDILINEILSSLDDPDRYFKGGFPPNSPLWSIHEISSLIKVCFLFYFLFYFF